MSYKRSVKSSTRIDEDANLELIKLAESSGYTKQFIASHAIMQVSPMGMLDPDWHDKMNALEKVNKTFVDLTLLDGPDICEQMTHGKGHWVCVQGKEGQTYTLKQISKDTDLPEALRICSKCTSSKKQKRELKALNEENAGLKEMLKAEAEGKAILVPRCRRGAKPNEDLTELVCPETGTWRPVKVRKKKKDPQPCEKRGSEPYHRCQWLIYDNLVVNGKLPEMNKKR